MNWITPTSYEQLRQKTTWITVGSGYLFVCLLMFLPASGNAGVSAFFSGATLPLDGRLSRFRDTSGLTQEEVHRMYQQHPETFQASSARLAAGFDAAAYWFRIDIDGLDAESRLILDVGRPHLHSVRVYQPDAGLNFQVQQQGQRFVYNKDAPAYRGAAFYLEVNELEPVVYVRVESTTTLTITLRLWEESDFFSYQVHYNLLMGFLYGALALMLVLGMLQFAFTGQIILLLFAGYQLVALVLYLTLHGYLKLYFLPDTSVLPLWPVGFFSCVSTSLLAFLTAHLLNLEKSHPYLYKGLILFGFGLASCSALVFFGLYPLFAEQAHQLRLLLVILASGLSFYLALQGSRVALLFFLSFFPQLFLVGLRSLSLLGLMPHLIEPDLLSALILASHLLQVALVFQSIHLKLLQLARSKQEAELTYQTALQQAKLEKQASLAQKDFMAMLAHEFRNPLAVINNVAALLPKAAQHQAIDLEQLSRHLDQANQKLTELLSSCLTDERLDSGLRELQPCHFSFAGLLKKLQQELDPRCKRIHIHNQNVDRCYADPILLALALRNLLDNALRYSPADQVVRLEVQQNQQDLMLRVTDQGSGIAPAEQEAVFQRFYRGQAGLKVPSGYGLGLYLVKQIVRLHQGEITLTSPPGKGACFTLRLPVFHASQTKN